MADKDYHAIVTDLIANAIKTSRVTGENGRITRLVAGSIGRFAAELTVGNQQDEAVALIEHARELLDAGDGAELVPALTAAVAAMAGVP